MATFPTLSPSSRTYSPGEYPHSPFTGMSGVQSRVRNSNVMIASQLRLTFVAITESQMLSILSHYQGQQGTFRSFGLPSDVWSGTSDPADYQLSGYGWRYIEPPSVSDAMCADAYDVELTLETVPPEGTALVGLNSIVQFSIVGGTASTANGANLTVTASIEYGAALVAGLAETVTMSLAAGSVAVDAAPPAFDRIVAWNIAGGTASGINADANGATLSVAVSFAGGTASTVNSFTWATANTTNPTSNTYRLYAPGIITVNSYMRLSTTTSSGYNKTKLLLLTSGTSVTIVVKGTTHVGTVVNSAALEDSGTSTERVVLTGTFSPALASTATGDGAMQMFSAVF